MEKAGVWLSVLVHGRDVKEYTHEGRTFVEGREGSCFSLLVSNGTGNKVLFVPSVDGLSALDGRPVDLDEEPNGYVVGPGESKKISGWRTSANDVSRFVFSKKGQSYASVVGEDVDCCGVVGVAAYLKDDRFDKIRAEIKRLGKKLEEERKRDRVVYPPVVIPSVPQTPWVDPWHWPSRQPFWMITTGSATTPLDAGNCSAVSCFSGLSAADQQIGVGFGETLSEAEGATGSESFEKAAKPFAIVEIFYDTLSGLRRRGVPVDGERRREARLPSAFRNSGKYCQIPS